MTTEKSGEAWPPRQQETYLIDGLETDRRTLAALDLCWTIHHMIKRGWITGKSPLTAAAIAAFKKAQEMGYEPTPEESAAAWRDVFANGEDQ